MALVALANVIGDRNMDHLLIAFGAWAAIQLFGTFVLTPRLLSRPLGLKPLPGFIALLAASLLLGPLGFFLAVPALAIANVFWQYFGHRATQLLPIQWGVYRARQNVLLVLLVLFPFCGWLYSSRRSDTGLPAGLLVYDDAGHQHLQRPLVSHRLRLAGRPDYLIDTAEGLVPVELKSGACPDLDRMPLMWPS